jgi:Predicted AAA-ATPase
MMSQKKLKISIGSDDFITVRTESDFFVDNSDFIIKVLDSGEIAQVITMPRRMGKSLNLSMLKYFLKREVDNEGKVITPNPYSKFFTGGSITSKLNETQELKPLKIANSENENYLRHQGQYPVIFISFKDVVGDTPEKVKASLVTQVHRLYKEHSYLANSSCEALKPHKDELNKYLSGQITDNLLTTSLSFLSELLYKHHDNRKVWILVDEYDKPANQFYEEVNYFLQGNITDAIKDNVKKVTETITTVLASGGKGNNYLAKFIATGIFDSVKKDGTSGFNNVKIHGITDPAYADSFGFSNEEVLTLIEKINFKNNSDAAVTKIGDWYDGYTLPLYNGSLSHTYTPWSVLNYLAEASKNTETLIEPKSFWSKTGANTFLKSLLKPFIHNHLVEKFHLLTQGNEVKLEYDELTSLFNLNIKSKSHAEQVFSYLLVNAGYLTVRKVGSEHLFKIPNLEVKKEFFRIIETEIQDFQASDLGTSIEIQGKKFSLLQMLSYTLSFFDENKTIKPAINAIITKDESFFKLHNYSGKCEEQFANFNLLHIASLSDNLFIYNTLSNACKFFADSKNKLLPKDKLFKLTPADYFFMSQKYSVQTKQYDEFLTIDQTTWYEGLFCNNITTSITTTIIGGAISALGYMGLNLCNPTAHAEYKCKQYGIAAAIFTVPTGANLLFQYLKQENNWCKKYLEYSLIDITDPENFTSLLQFEKYKMEKEDAYVTLNPICDEQYKQISVIEAPMFNFPTSPHIIFTLCEYNPASGSLHQPDQEK